MLFNSLEYLIFLPLVIMVYFSIPNRFRWMLLLAASYYFYMCWKAEYIVLIVVSTAIDYFAGLQMGKTEERSKRRKYLILSLISNLGILFAFKYFNFFNHSLQGILSQFNIFYEKPYFDALLPVGISFYTFQTMSYSIDVYRGLMKPEKHFGIFALYVTFFPQLVAGPIERATSLLPQFRRIHTFDYQRATDGLKLILWGFFKKVVIADYIAGYVDIVYNSPGAYSGLHILAATYLFAFQIFCDFSGYSDIAIGSAKIMGYDLMKNFDRPYFAASIREFWQRWHISLSTWFKDYLYIPLGGNRGSRLRWYFNLFFVFLVSGLWHGANTTFVIWGALHGLYFVFSIFTKNIREKLSQVFLIDRIPSLQRLFRVFITFHLVLLSWVFFRANSKSDLVLIFKKLLVIDFTNPGITLPEWAVGKIWYAFGLILFMEMIHIYQSFGSVKVWLSERPLWFRWACYYAIILIILTLGEFNKQQFIYFQF